MPGSSEIFGTGDSHNKSVNLGMSDILPPGMFSDFSKIAGKGIEPTPEEIEAAAEAARYNKTVVIKEFHANTFDLSDKNDLESYKNEIVKIYEAMKLKCGVISYNEKKLIVVNGKPRMVVHIEWYEYNMKVSDNMTGKIYNSVTEFLEHKHEEKRGSDKKTDSK